MDYFLTSNRSLLSTLNNAMITGQKKIKIMKQNLLPMFLKAVQQDDTYVIIETEHIKEWIGYNHSFQMIETLLHQLLRQRESHSWSSNFFVYVGDKHIKVEVPINHPKIAQEIQKRKEEKRKEEEKRKQLSLELDFQDQLLPFLLCQFDSGKSKILLETSQQMYNLLVSKGFHVAPTDPEMLRHDAPDLFEVELSVPSSLDQNKSK